MRTVYLDIETTLWFDAPELAGVPRWQQLARLPWGLVVTWDELGGWREWEAAHAPGLWSLLTGGDRQIITWNGDEFDIPYVAVQARIRGYPNPPELEPVSSFDLMAWITRETKRLDGKGRWYKLDTIAAVNLGRGKIADGKQAAVWLQSGDPAERAQALQYCRDDVQILRDLHERLLGGGRIICPARPDRREYRELALSLGAGYAAERAAAQGGTE
jgi:hypothetical protein